MVRSTNGQGTSPFAEWVKNISELKMSEDERIAVVESLIDDIYQKLDEVTGLQFLNNEGSALYLTQSKINHSSHFPIIRSYTVADGFEWH